MSATHKNSEELGSIEKLRDGDGFQIWKFRLTLVLKAKGLFQQLTDAPSRAEDKLAEWLNKDAKVQNLIVSTVEDQQLIHITGCGTSREMWNKLNAIFERDSEQRNCSLMEELFTYRYKSDKDMATHIAYLKNIVFKLQALGCQIEEKMLIMKILTTLPDRYKFFTSVWESTPRVEKALDNLTARLLMEQAKSKANQEETVVFKVTEKRCYKCNSSTHLASACRSTAQHEGKKGKGLKCFVCSKMGHVAKDCRNKRVDQREGYSFCNICKRRNHV